MPDLNGFSKEVGLSTETLIKILEAEGFNIDKSAEVILSYQMVETVAAFIRNLDNAPNRGVFLINIYDFIKANGVGNQQNKKPSRFGVVSYFNEDRGFGFIESDSLEKIFVHISQVRNQRLLKESELVSYVLAKTNRREGGYEAKEVDIIDESYHNPDQLYIAAWESKKRHIREAILKAVPVEYVTVLLNGYFQKWLIDVSYDDRFIEFWRYYFKRVAESDRYDTLVNLVNLLPKPILEERIKRFVLDELIPVGNEAVLEALIFNGPSLLSLSYDNIVRLFASCKSWLDREGKMKFEAKLKDLITASIRVELYLEGVFQFISVEDIRGSNLEETDLHFRLWQQDDIDILPLLYIRRKWMDGELLDEIEDWLSAKKIEESLLLDALWTNVKNWPVIATHKTYAIFARHLDLIHRLNDKILVSEYASVPPGFQPHLAFWLWMDGDDQFFDFETIKRLLIFLEPDQQIRALRRLFFYKHTGRFNLTVEHLDQILRIDEDIYQLNQKYHPEVFLDISVAIVISLIKSLKEDKTFLSDTNLLTIALENITGNRKRKFVVTELFEKCPGRTTCSWTNKGKVKKETIDNGDPQFVLSFDYDADLVEAVKRAFPRRSYSREEHTWSIPSQYEEEVLAFAEEYQFLLEFDGSAKTASNDSLIDLSLGSKPAYIHFCEGRPANILHRTYQLPFWWCLNQPCFQNAESIHIPEQWEQYTLLDLLLIMGFQLDAHNGIDYIEKGKYYQFVGTVNRFNRLLERLYCHHCEEILSPSKDSHYAYHRVTRFYCSNENCPEHKNEIYLHHCLNPKCANIIDSRISKKCTNGWTICDNLQCGCCCSHEQYQKRLSNLETGGGAFVNQTREAVRSKIGHLERAMHYCYKCGGLMDERDREIFKCRGCNIEYDLRRNFFNRAHKSTEENKPRSSSEYFPDQEY